MVETTEAKRRRRRSKDAERSVGKWLLENDGEDPIWKNISSSTGRVGHVTGLQFDVVSKTYAGEVKNVKVPASLWKWWRQIVEIANRHGKDPLLVLEPTNVVPEFALLKKVPALHIITEDRHRQLLEIEREFNAGREV